MLTEDQILERIKSEDNIANRFNNKPKLDYVHVEEKRSVGMPKGQKIVPPSLKNAIALLSRTKIDSQHNIGASFGISQPAVSNISTGKTHHDIKKVEAQLTQVRDVAMEKLMVTLGLMTDDKLEGVKAIDLSKIASNVSLVVSRTLPKEEAPTNQNIQLLVYSPVVKDESSFEVIEV